MKQFLSCLMTMHTLASVPGLIFHAIPSWLPKLCSLSSFFFSVCLPGIPKWFFIIVNIIIIFLVCEARLSTSKEEPGTYEEYVERSVNLRGMANGEEKQEESAVEDSLIEEEEKDGEVVEKIKEEEEERSHGREEMERACEESDGKEEEELELSAGGELHCKYEHADEARSSDATSCHGHSR